MLKTTELADSIEFTAAFRHAMGLPTQYPPATSRIPMPEAVTQIPEWQAATGQISAEEYLACFGYSDQPIQLMKNGQAGENKLWKKVRKKVRKTRDLVE